jgi:hypothetical protein
MAKDYVPTNLYGIRFYDPISNEMRISEVYAHTAEDARRVFNDIGPKHKEEFDVLELDDYKELLTRNGFTLREDLR